MKKTVSLYVDGRIIFADQGTTILEAARHNGIMIPTLCYHPRLEPLGHCRMCIVKIEGIERPVTSCDNPVAEGMLVTTDTPELQKMRSDILELSLATHPYKDCLTCVRTGTCELQEKAYQYQVNLPEQLDRTTLPGKSDDNLYLVRDEEKCILCGRCIQVCRSGPGRSVYSMIGKGVNTRVVPFRNGREVSLEEAGCIFCGQCVDVCPVAALTEKGRSSGGREWELTHIPGVCTECSLGCYLERQASGRDLIKISVPVEGERVSWLCQKGKFGFIKTESTDKPLIAVRKRVKAGYSDAAYGDAVRETAEKFIALKEKYGSKALAVLSSGQLSNEENYLLQKLTRTVIGSPNIDLGAEPGWVTAYNMMQEVTGTGIIGPTPASISNAETLFIIGTKLEESHPVAAMAIGRAGRFGDAVIIRTDQATAGETAWESMTIKPGKGGYETLLNSISKIKQEEGSAGKTAKPGVSADLIRKAARLLSASKSCIIVSPTFFHKADQGTIEALLNMARIFGHIERGRSNLLLLSRYSNAAGVLSVGGTPHSTPGFNDPDSNSGLNREEVLVAAREGSIKGLYLFGSSFTGHKFNGQEFLASLCASEEEAPVGADFIFSAQPIIYKNGLFTNSAGQIRFNQSLLEQAPYPQEDWRLICDLARAMGVKWPYNSLDDVREEMKGLIYP